jgi:PAS domain-containing protein
MAGHRLRGGFAFPVQAEGRIIGVLTFSSLKAREPDQRLLAASAVIGSQIGQFLQRKSAEASLRESEARFRSLTQMSSTSSGKPTRRTASRSWCTARLSAGGDGTRRDRQDGLGAAKRESRRAGWAAHRDALDQHKPFRDFEFARRMPDGVVRVLSISGDPRFGPGGAFVGYRGVGRDVTEIALARERIASLAYSDPLTGLAEPHQPAAGARPGGAARAAQEFEDRGRCSSTSTASRRSTTSTATMPATRC